VLTADAAPEGIDFECPLLSLPAVFGTTLDDIPAQVPYLAADPVRVAAWQSRLGEPRKPRVGIAWSGNVAQARDHLRSMSLADLLPLLDDRAAYVSLQKDLRAEDAALLASRPDILHFGADLHDFDDTAALVACMDRVVSVDTSVAHLAGAMATDVAILLAFNADWRWLREREDCPWYPTARLWRQPAPGDWASVVDRLRGEIA
jgi:ADP-heptose:LPS heptosyltransferase